MAQMPLHVAQKKETRMVSQTATSFDPRGGKSEADQGKAFVDDRLTVQQLGCWVAWDRWEHDPKSV